MNAPTDAAAVREAGPAIERLSAAVFARLTTGGSRLRFVVPTEDQTITVGLLDLAAAIRHISTSRGDEVEGMQAIVQGFVDDLTSNGTNRPGSLSIDHDKLLARIAEARDFLGPAAAIRQLDLPGGEEVERLRAVIIDRLFAFRGGDRRSAAHVGLYAECCREADAILAITPARVERSGEGGGA